ncbi:hypothetical protein [Nocardia sp. NPDC004604]|uniref:hypothetical protein n=1 Tax=Nocardia sp. NPDC004604 TaxID=3157013 RepID=UPI0033A1CD16
MFWLEQRSESDIAAEFHIDGPRVRQRLRAAAHLRDAAGLPQAFPDVDTFLTGMKLKVPTYDDAVFHARLVEGWSTYCRLVQVGESWERRPLTALVVNQRTLADTFLGPGEIRHGMRQLLPGRRASGDRARTQWLASSEAGRTGDDAN